MSIELAKMDSVRLIFLEVYYNTRPAMIRARMNIPDNADVPVPVRPIDSMHLWEINYDLGWMLLLGDRIVAVITFQLDHHIGAMTCFLKGIM